MSVRGLRFAAEQTGHTTYFTGVPCKHGHVAPRKTSGGACTICRDAHRHGVPPTEVPNKPAVCDLCNGSPYGRGNTLHLDHDHMTYKFRGWLCYGCNSSLGKLGDNVAGLKRALAYVGG